jgi:hypothetical protein
LVLAVYNHRQSNLGAKPVNAAHVLPTVLNPLCLAAAPIIFICVTD